MITAYGKTLYDAAEAADAAFSHACQAISNGKRTRWTLTRGDWRDDRVNRAFETKLAADRAWLNFMRGNVNG